MDTGEYDGGYAQSCQSWNIQKANTMVYIQSDYDRKLPHHFDAACAMYGAMDNAQDVRLTSFEEVQSGKFDRLIKTNLFVGSVEFMREVFNRAGKSPAAIINNDRQYTTMTVKKVREVVADGGKLFVKPFQQKLFSGLVVDPYSISTLREQPDDLEIMTYTVIENIKSEWRAYVLYGKVEDCRNYSGDFKIAPNYEWVERVIKNLRDKLPVSFTADVGVVDNNGIKGDFVVEFNDMYAIGNYGLENSVYLRMLRERYFEIMRSHE